MREKGLENKLQKKKISINRDKVDNNEKVK